MVPHRRTVLVLTGAVLAGMSNATSAGGTEAGVSKTPSSDRVVFDGTDESDVPEFPALELTTDPSIETDRLAEQVRGNVAAAFDVLEQLREEAPDENCFFSPYSISIAMAMTYAGARGETAAEVADALRYELDEEIHSALCALENEFERRNEDGADVPEAENDDALGFQFSSANAVWVDEGLPLDDEYTGLLETYYGAGEHLVDFAGNPDAAREEINEWVEDRTNDRIEDLLVPGTVDSLTRLVLTNAVYFLAAWEHEFDPEDTETATFSSLDGTEAALDMMHQSARLQYAEIDGHQLVELPYVNGETSMVVVLPAEGEFERFEEEFAVDRLSTMLAETATRDVDLALPSFGIESKFSLVETLQELGVERAFGDGADFAGMVEGDTSNLYIGDVVHQSFVEVDEEGTEAAAATAVLIEEEELERATMTVDRPFLFYIRDQPTETPLFVGRVVDGTTLQDE